MRATTEHFLAHLIRPTTRYQPDIEALRAASTCIVVAGGATSKGQLANRTAVVLVVELIAAGDRAGVRSAAPGAELPGAR